MPAAIAALAAEKQGKFWEFHDLLFKDYSHLNEEKIKEIAQQLKLNMEKFEKDRKDPQIMAMINRDLAEGNLRNPNSVYQRQASAEPEHGRISRVDRKSAEKAGPVGIAISNK